MDILVKSDENKKNLVQAYCHEMGLEAVIPDSLPSLIKGLAKGGKERVFLSQSKLSRGVAKIRGMKRGIYEKTEILAEQYFAMKDAFRLLSKKGIPVYFYNRVGLMKNGFSYSEAAKKRMEQRLSFPLMYEDIPKYADEFRDIMGAIYSSEYVEQLGKIPQVIMKGDKYCHEDCKSSLINVLDGKRITCYQPETFTQTLHIYGRCGAFGYAVEDKDTFPSQLQKLLTENGYSIRVVNHGLWGGYDSYIDHNFLKEVLSFGSNDIILFYQKHFNQHLQKKFAETGVWYKEITEEWHKFPESKGCFYDRPGHMNHIGYQHVAELIFKDLKSKNFAAMKTKQTADDIGNTQYLNAYLKEKSDTKFIEDINVFVKKILNEHPPLDENAKCGSIVMNCNPFTKGHRYLIETACKQVDRLYVFVVEEDRSFFKFEDRYEMVEKGTEDLEKVVVAPSGEFMISSLTFPEYFMKDYVKEKNFDVSMDLEVFCQYIAPPLHISVRFAGEEPFDPVTLNYNENMRRILPDYGMSFCEIPRLAIDDERIINATAVRKLLAEKKYDELKEYIPLSTYEVLEKKYFK